MITSRTIVNGLAPHSSYSFRLCAHNNEGNSPFTKIVTFSTILGISVPPILLPEQCKPASDSLWLRWICDDHFTDSIDNYEIQYCFDSIKHEETTHETSYRLENLIPGTCYQYE